MASGLRSNSDAITTRNIVAPVTGPPSDAPGAPGGGDPTLARLVGADDLRAIEALASTGLLVRTGANTWALRSVGVPAALLGITNPAGVAGDPTLTLPVRAANLVFAGPGAGADAAPAFRALVAADLPFTFVEGMFVPTITFATPGDLSVAYAAQEGAYLRVGSTVFFSVVVRFTPTFSTAAGNLIFQGLPFVGAAPNGRLVAAITTGTVTFPAGRTFLLGATLSGTTTFILAAYGSAVAAAVLTAAEVTSGGDRAFAVAGMYSI